MMCRFDMLATILTLLFCGLIAILFLGGLLHSAGKADEAIESWKDKE